MRKRFRTGLFALVFFVCFSPHTSFSKDLTQKEIQDRLEQLEEDQRKLKEQLKAQEDKPVEPEEKKEEKVEAEEGSKPVEASEPTPPKPTSISEHVPFTGMSIAKTSWAELIFTPYAYARYLNQLGIDKTRTDSFGRTFDIDRQHNITLSKVVLYFKGWLGIPKFRYFFYVWTANANQGLGAQVVAAGNISYLFDKHFNLGLGIHALPSTPSTRGNFPFWLRVDARPISDEYFRGSYTTGIYAWGDATKNLHYKVMLANNLSTLGVDAGQLDEGLNTISSSIWWTTDNMKPYEGFGDFEHHAQPALSLWGAYTRSRESKQSQPGIEDPENTQIRVSDGTAIFDLGAFAPGVQINNATYQMSSFATSVKYRGFGLDLDYFLRWVNDLDATGALPRNSFFDHGLQAQASMMIVKKILQIYGYHSTIFGQFGTPWEVGGGFNITPLKSRMLRINLDLDYLRHAPVGYLAYPTTVGANGPIFMTNVEVTY